MKHFSIIFVLVMLFALVSTSFAQVSWTKYDDPTTPNPPYAESDPVLQPGLPGEWDDFSLYPFSILFDGNTYHLWYGGHDGTSARIGYATSTDGITWTKDSANNPVLQPGLPGEWDDTGLQSPYVLFDGNTYHMWYIGEDGQNSRIGYATSTDRVTWTKYDDSTTTNPPFAESDPVLDISPEGTWQIDGYDSPCVLFDGINYHMWYHAWVPDLYRICYATSLNGINWTKHFVVLDTGSTGTWDSYKVLAPDVYFDGTKYHMWYSGNSTDWEDRIGYATSPDGIIWTKDSMNNPVLEPGSSGEWDSRYVTRCRVIKDSATSTYKMWYVGGDVAGPPTSFGYATAPDASVGINVIDESFPNDYMLSQNYPNPFNPTTNIEFSIPKSEFVTLKIYNILGEEVATLVSQRLAAGSYKYDWDVGRLAGGIYLCRIQAGNFVEAKKMVLLK